MAGVEKGLPLMLEVLAKHDVPATFFITGLAADRFSGLIAEISQRYEVSCHGYEHESISNVYTTWPTHLAAEKLFPCVLGGYQNLRKLSAARCPELTSYSQKVLLVKLQA